MKKNLKLGVNKFLLPLILGGSFGMALGQEIKYGDEVYIKNVVNKKYAVRDVNVLVGKKESGKEASFKMVADLENPSEKKGEKIKYGNPIYFQSTTAKVPTFIGDSGEKYRIYGMSRTLLGAVTEKGKIYKFVIWPAAGTKKAEAIKEEYNKTGMVTRKPIFYNEEINIQSEPSKKSFRFNTDLSTYKFGTEIFISDDSKLMTPKAKKDTKKLVLQKVGK